MKCLSRSTLGVAIGSINIFGFTITIIYIIVTLCDFSKLSEEDKKQNREIISSSIKLLYILLVVCLVAIIVSALLIVGIVKRRHNFMKPFIYFAIAGFVCQIFRLIVGTIGSLVVGSATSDVFLTLCLGLLTLAIQYLLFYPIYTLYKNIRDGTNEVEHESLSNDVEDKPPSYGELEKAGEL